MTAAAAWDYRQTRKNIARVVSVYGIAAREMTGQRATERRQSRLSVVAPALRFLFIPPENAERDQVSRCFRLTT